MDLELVYNEETQEWEPQKEPFITIDVETEEDFEFIENAIAFYKKHMDEQVKPQTNADRIRAMSDEGLMQFLFNEVSNNTICSFCVPTMRTKYKCDGHCKNGILEWLKQPAEGELL